jgi:Fe-S-cluster containining protein
MRTPGETKPTFRILGERVETRPDLADAAADPDVENPYWTFDEQDPHPNPELGCMRRGLCCKSSPGWYAPGEVEKSAELLGLSPDEFVRRYLVIDQIDVDGQMVHVFAPVKLGIDGKPAIPPASRADALYRTLRGTCIFFKDNGCGIYEARPLECRQYICTNTFAIFQ